MRRPTHPRLPLAPLYALLLAPLLGSCSMHSLATRWNGHVGPDGEPVFVLTSTYLGLHLTGMIPMAGETTIEAMVDESTRWITAADGSRLRLVETESSNFWWALPPLSWIFSPVLTSVTFEYRPSADALARAAAAAGPADADPAAPSR